MSIVQFFRIIWARRMLVLAATVSCLLGALLLTLILPARYDSHARVLLGLLKPDPVTGMVISGPATGAYVATQTELVTDYSVAGQVADTLGWPSDPNLIAAYQGRPGTDHRDFHHWVAQRVIDNTKAKLVEGSNILEITFTASRPDDAQKVAEVLQNAYLQTSLSIHRQDTTRDADWFDQQAQKAKLALGQAEDARTDFERANGVVMQDDKLDVESARLQTLVQQGVATMPMVPGAAQASPSTVELAQIDAQIAQQSKILGPNHPDLQALRERRRAVAALAAKDQAAQRRAAAEAAGATSAGASALSHALEQQKGRVIAQRDKLEKLKQLQAEVDMRREQYDKTAAHAAELRQQAAATDTGLTVLGHATTPKAPSFPNYLLIIPGAIVLGMGVGVMVALLAELLGRRVRSIEDAESVSDIHVIAVIPSPASEEPAKAASRPWWRRFKWPTRRRMVPA
ncbi:MAG TPA: Wzz/FepE/Etk N-terminal domain-containing protein [Caulobacteraceae bacterium]|nr:Wzz/FepE/Etk N-terminal domain-containing protein [Caulobacteraceae bacterium]